MITIIYRIDCILSMSNTLVKFITFLEIKLFMFIQCFLDEIEWDKQMTISMPQL